MNYTIRKTIFNLGLVQKRNFIKILLSVLIVVIPSLALSASTKTQQNNSLPLADIQRFTSVVEHVKNYYVNPVEDNELFENAIRGMLSGLDPHSAYLDKEEFEDLKFSTTGKFGGLGIEVTMQDGFIRVISPIDDTPAQKAGVQSGDIIVRLDGAPIKGVSLKEAVDKMRGKPGTSISLTIIREGENQPLEIKVVRDIINVVSVKTRLLDKHYGYVRISNFQSDTAKELIKNLSNLQKEAKNSLKGIILDLRNNPGGVLDASVQIADAFLDHKKIKYDGVIVFTKGRMASSQIKEVSRSGDMLNGAPIIVLVNGGSASASEIVAGALQDHKRAIVMGTKTFGKGSVQTILPLKDQRGLKLTTALYYTPNGKSIQAKGIEPDVIVENVLIPKPKEEEKVTLFFSEKDLERHLENNNEKTSNVDKEKMKKDLEKDLIQGLDDGNGDVPLLYRDYQLNEALNMLKGMALVK